MLPREYERSKRSLNTLHRKRNYSMDVKYVIALQDQKVNQFHVPSGRS